MRYRVRLDLGFPAEADAQSLITLAKNLIAKSTSMNEDKMNAEISYLDLEKCFHDEAVMKPCERLERQEVRKGKVEAMKAVEI